MTLAPGPFAGFVFEPSPVRKGNEWQVYAKYPGGYRGHILSFKSEADAKAWLKWLATAQPKPPEDERAEETRSGG
jgi:hypothetical protein